MLRRNNTINRNAHYCRDTKYWPEVTHDPVETWIASFAAGSLDGDNKANFDDQQKIGEMFPHLKSTRFSRPWFSQNRRQNFRNNSFHLTSIRCKHRLQCYLTINCVRWRRMLPNFVGLLWMLVKALRVFWAFFRVGSYDITFSLCKGFCLMRHKTLSSSRTSGFGGRVVEEFRSCLSKPEGSVCHFGLSIGRQLWRQFVTFLGFIIKVTIVHVAV